MSQNMRQLVEEQNTKNQQIEEEKQSVIDDKYESIKLFIKNIGDSQNALARKMWKNYQKTTDNNFANLSKKMDVSQNALNDKLLDKNKEHDVLKYIKENIVHKTSICSVMTF